MTRFAPSPTGYLHLGHVVNAVYVWGLARLLGGTVLLRIEDHDRSRSRVDFDAAILEDLEWLGFLETRGAAAPALDLVRQSGRTAAYEDALARLRRMHHVYACGCSRSEIGGGRYPGRCRTRGLTEQPGRGLRIELGPGSETFDDLLLGAIRQTPADECGDLLIRDRHGSWTYQFAVTVDDLWQGVTLVVRGADLVSSTGRQLRLARMLREAGVPAASTRVPVYLHHPLLFDSGGAKLSKADGAAGVRMLRQQGLTAPDVIGRAAAAAGLIPRARPIPSADVPTLFADLALSPDEYGAAGEPAGSS